MTNKNDSTNHALTLALYVPQKVIDQSNGHAKAAHEDLVTFTGEDGTSFKMLFDPSRLMDDNAYEYGLFTEKVSIVSIRLQAVTGNTILTELTEPVVNLTELYELPHFWRQFQDKPSGSQAPDGTVLLLTVESFVPVSCTFGIRAYPTTILIKLPTRFGRPVSLKIEALDMKQTVLLLDHLNRPVITGALPLQLLGYGDGMIYARPHFDAKIICPVETETKSRFYFENRERAYGPLDTAA